ncbi:hypothetical protein HK102_009181 [Quaeritorhiza haematococci]|nr:hypothetical protein HK102_009181 [Quaeritorhiza haematococci]
MKAMSRRTNAELHIAVNVNNGTNGGPPSAGTSASLKSPDTAVPTTTTTTTATTTAGGRTKVARVCQGCKAESTPEWRRGPNGDKILCNACGLRFNRIAAKQARLSAMKAQTAATAKTSTSTKTEAGSQTESTSSSTVPNGTHNGTTASPTGTASQKQ